MLPLEAYSVRRGISRPTSGVRYGSCWTWGVGVEVRAGENSGDAGDDAVALWDRGGDRWWSNIRALSGFFFFFYLLFRCLRRFRGCVDGKSGGGEGGGMKECCGCWK